MRTEGTPPAALRNIVVHTLPVRSHADLAGRERASFAVNGLLWAALEREGPFDMVYERYSLWSFAGMEYASMHRISGLLEVNAPLIEEQDAHRGLVNRALALDISAKVWGTASAILAVSRGVANYLGRQHAAPGRVHVVPNGVNADRFGTATVPTLPAGNGVFTVGFVGTLKPWHGLPTLVDAFAELHLRRTGQPGWMHGDGPERERLEVDLECKGIRGAAHLVGAVSHEEIPGLLASMDAERSHRTPSRTTLFLAAEGVPNTWQQGCRWWQAASAS